MLCRITRMASAASAHNRQDHGPSRRASGGGLLTPQFLDELRNRTLLSALVGRAVKLAKAGREFKGCCPFHHEKTPSFYVNDEKSFYHCFGCGAHGDAIRFLTEARGLPFMDAVKELAAAAGMELPAPDPRGARAGGACRRAARRDGGGAGLVPPPAGRDRGRRGPRLSRPARHRRGCARGVRPRLRTRWPSPASPPRWTA